MDGEDNQRYILVPESETIDPPMVLRSPTSLDRSKNAPESDSTPITQRQKFHAPAKARLTTIFSFNNEESADFNLEVTRQVQYQGFGIISSTEAAQTASSFGGIINILHKLNEVFGTNYSLQDRIGLEDRLKTYIEAGYDFGTIYAYLQHSWFYRDFCTACDDMEALRALDRERRVRAYDTTTERILNPHIPPRRVWDLFSNRVIPYWASPSPPAAVSHSWMNRDDIQLEDTPINAHEWRVPIPKDTTLERVRIELLSYGLHYVWLDVLCLRQKDREENEPLRLEEWRLDVPTIGSIYGPTTQIVHYYSGLGRPFRIENLDNDRHWLNRAWTLQEISVTSYIAGIAEDSPISPEIDEETNLFADPLVHRFYATLASLQANSQDMDNIFPALFAMRHRAATSELDKVMGLAYLLGSRTLPTYIEGQSSEDAWKRLVQHILPRFRGDLLFLFHCPGQDPNHLWYPSWQQIKDILELPRGHAASIGEDVNFDEESGLYFHRGYRLDKCFVRGLAQVELGGMSVDSHNRRKGSIVIVNLKGLERTFPVYALHSEPISDGYYTLVGGRGFEYWIVGERTSSRRIRKISVLKASTDTAETIQASARSLPGHWLTSEYA